MKYIVGEIHKGKAIVDTITDNPVSYAYSYEPIDLINGEQYVWNDKGERFIFLTGSEFDVTTKSDSRISIVDTGTWGSDGPVLQPDGKDTVEFLRPALIGYITNDGEADLSLSFADLIEIAFAKEVKQ